MTSGPYETPLRRFANCADKVLEKNKTYTINEASELCKVDPRTVGNYVSSELAEVNKLMPAPKFIVAKESCGCYKGLMVDPPASSKRDVMLLPRCVSFVGGSILALDGARRLTERNRVGIAELALGAGIELLSIFV